MESKYINLVINRLTQAQYDELKTNNQVSEEELYVITDHDDLFYYKTELYTREELDLRFSELSNSLSELENNVNENVSSQLSTLETELSGFKTNVETTYATKQELSEYSPVGANPVLSGTEPILESIDIDGTNYRVYPEGTVEFSSEKSTDENALTLRSITVGNDIWNIAGGTGGGDADLSDYYTKTETDTAINTAITEILNNAPEAYDTLKEIADYIESDSSNAASMLAAINNKADKSEVYTQAEANAKFATLADIPEVPDLTDYYTKNQTEQVIDDKIEAVTGLDNYYNKTEIDAKVETINANKQDTLISGTNIKTINGESVLGEGNITIVGGGGESVEMIFSDTAVEGATPLKNIQIGEDNWGIPEGGGSDIVVNPELDGTELELNSIGIEGVNYAIMGDEVSLSTETKEGNVLKSITVGETVWKIDDYTSKSYVDTSLSSKLDKTSIVYSETEPTNPVVGMIWLKPLS